LGTGCYKLCSDNQNCKDNTSRGDNSRLPLGALSRVLRDKRYGVSRDIVLYLLRNVTATPGELTKAIGVDRRRISDALRRLEKLGIVKLVRRPGSNRVLSVELIAPDSPENARTIMTRGNELFCGLIFDGFRVDNVRGLLRGGGWVGGDRGVRFGLDRLGWFEYLSYVEFDGLFVVDRVPLSSVQLYWSRRDRRLVLEVRPRRGVVRRGLLWESVCEGLALNVVSSFEVLLRIDPRLACRVLRFLIDRAGFCLR